MTPLRIVLAVLAAACAMLPAGAGAQNWPAKPVRIIAVFPPGGSVDQVARILAQQLTVQTGQQVIVENKGGASGSIGTALLAKSDPDGYTLGVVFDTHAVNPALIPNLPFDTLRDLTPIMLVGTGGMALVTHVSQPYKSFQDVVTAAKTKPGSVSYGTIGAGSLGHLAMAQLGNQVPLAIGSVFLVQPYVSSGRLRAIAVTSAKPDPQLPGAAPIAAQGVPGFEAYTWWGVFGPANLPAPLARRIYDELAKAVKAPAVRDKLVAQGIDVQGAPPAELDAFVRKEMPRWAKVIKDNNIKSGD